MIVVLSLLIWLVAIAIAITIHEYSHALAADKLGDPTPSLQNRLSLNPLKHYDRVGTTMLLVTALSQVLPGFPHLPIFGWAKPVEFDPFNLHNPKRDGALIALAGPAANIVLSILLGLLLKNFFLENLFINNLLFAIIEINVFLAVFNLIPIHPLDGSKILYWLLPDSLAREYDVIMRRYGLFILIFLIFPFGGTSPLVALIGPIITALMNLIL